MVVSEFDGARIVMVNNRPVLQLLIERKGGGHIAIPVTATLSQSKAKDGKASLPFANLNIGGENIRFMPEVAEAIAPSAARVDSEVSAV